MLMKIAVASIVSAALIGALVAVPAFAGDSSGDPGLGYGYGYRPGWGYGDPNHDHTGPPGHEDTKPGWGYGDPNHDHSGPPGFCDKHADDPDCGDDDVTELNEFETEDDDDEDGSKARGPKNKSRGRPW